MYSIMLLIQKISIKTLELTTLTNYIWYLKIVVSFYLMPSITNMQKLFFLVPDIGEFYRKFLKLFHAFIR